MRKLLVSATAVFLACGGIAFAGPPDEGYVGALVYKNGTEPERIACDTLDLVKMVYKAGLEKGVLHIHPAYAELAKTKGTRGDPQCTLGAYSVVKVLEPAVLLGPIKNPIGDAKLYFWAVHVDNSPKGGSADYWILYLDTKTERPWLQVGERA